MADKRNAGKGTVKNVILFLILEILMLMPAVCLDILYSHFHKIWMSLGNILVKVHIFKEIYFQIKGTGLQQKAYDALTGNVGVLVTSIGVIITIIISISDRSEGMIFGISRKSLEFKTNSKIYYYGQYMILLSPVLLMTATVCQFYITGYWVLLLSYCFLIYCFWVYNSSFSRDEIALVSQKLVSSVPDDIVDIEDALVYFRMIGKISYWNKKEEGWENVEKLFWEISKTVVQSNIRKRYVLCCLPIWMRRNGINRII